ncbi:hypothetical protein DL89DRAFT_323745 [Linderina pennispora]|uniref:Uncharacterized protein n=1 Tax=Linderina pennispora TaxID=61395 RepID=A0A1Y1W3W8_9FUNG|nr:uncharacterized protein DL89DRAFT_323745 [Linderina pennispora]ORX68148.1 hypothetical protein DL89DRAFT_323745 [Linderina pennispora]
MTEHRGTLSFYIVITQLAVTAAASGILTNSVFALTAHFPPANAEGVMSGQAVAGIMATAAQLVTAYSVATGGLRSAEAGADSLIHRTVAYFAFAAITNIILTAAFIYIQRDPYYTERSKLAIAGATAGATVLPDLREFAATFRQISGYANVIMLVFAAMAAPSLADKPTIAGSIVAISISTGLAIGSLLSWPVRAAGCLCNPF